MKIIHQLKQMSNGASLRQPFNGILIVSLNGFSGVILISIGEIMRQLSLKSGMGTIEASVTLIHCLISHLKRKRLFVLVQISLKSSGLSCFCLSHLHSIMEGCFSLQFVGVYVSVCRSVTEQNSSRKRSFSEMNRS